jgi:hypothetical protein
MLVYEIQGDLNPKQREAMKLAQKNKQIVEELARHRVQVGNLLTTRHEMFVDFLLAQGIITQEQHDDFNIIWEQHVYDQLKPAREDVLRQIRQHQIMQGVPAEGQPGPSGLIVPGRG